MPNSQTNEKKRINILDFVLILLIIVILALSIISVIRNNPNTISGGDTTVSFTVKCEMLDKTVASNIEVGDSIYDNATNQLLGTVQSIEPLDVKAIDPKAICFDNPTGTVTTGKVNVTIVVTSTAWNDDGIYSVDGYRLAAGQNMNFHSEKFSINGLCTSVKPI